MAPISLPLANDSPDLRDVSIAVLRFKWESSDLDSKAVGGHLPLSKRNSTPLLSYDFGVPPPPYNKKAAAMPPQQQPQQLSPHSPPSAIHPSHNLEANGQHRRLDRSQSDPLRQQGTPPHGEGRTANGNGAGPATSASSSRYKTELCRPFAETGDCKYGDKCQFAHGPAELRSMPRHPKYKTELCRTFHTTGICGYGTRCHFIHNREERRSPAPSHSSTSSTNSSSLAMPHRATTVAPTNLPFIQAEETASGPMPFMPAAEDTPAPLPFIQASEDQSSSSVLTPPHSLNGSPTSPTGTFFNNGFNIFAQSDMLEVHTGLESMVSPHPEQLFGDAFSLSYMNIQPDTPPGSPPQSSGESLSSSPVESLADEVDNLAFTSDSVAAFDNGKYLRLPIFETLTEV